jgi:hypothetical protein
LPFFLRYCSQIPTACAYRFSHPYLSATAARSKDAFIGEKKFREETVGGV